jgi:6-phosphogluconolactonase (cycloisomerase 2 family)
MNNRQAAVAAVLATFLIHWSPNLLALEAAGSPSEKQPGDLDQVQNLSSDELASVTSVVISPDGRFAYAAAFNSDTITSFVRDPESGELKFLDSITQAALDCAVAFRLSRDGNLGVASAFRANAVTLFTRDAETGRLTAVDVAKLGNNGNAGLDFVIDAHFSPDNRFLYTAASDGVGVYRIEGNKLMFVEVQNLAGKLAGLRDVRLSPDGETIYAVGAGSDNLVVFARDQKTGTLKVRQVLADGEDGITALGGAFRAAVSPDGKHIYVSSGRFGGDNAVSVFGAQPDGTLKLIEELHNGSDKLENFAGGNDIGVSPDGAFVFALATSSDRLARFQRDAETGKLISIGSQAVGEKAEPGSAGLNFSPDGKFLYVADEDSSSIVVFRMP